MQIKVSVGRTYNIGNYTSVRLDVGIEKDIPDPQEEVELDSELMSAYFDMERVLEKMEREAKVRR
jgi:hypothetical protein